MDLATARTYSIFGTILASDYAFRSRLPEASSPPDCSFTCATEPPVPDDWTSSGPVMEGRYRLETGEPEFAVHRHADFEVMRFARGANFYLWPDRIVCELWDPSVRSSVELTFLGLVLSYWLERRGVLMLHASSVVVDGVGVLFLATKQGGKSSLAAAMLQRGCSLLSDDISPIRFDGTSFQVYPGYPQMRLWPTEATRFLGHFEDLERVHPSETKRQVPVGANGLGSFCASPRTLGSIYVPERENTDRGDIHIATRAHSQAVIDLVRHSFAPHLVEAVGLQPKRLALFSQLVQHVPVRTLRYPSGFDHLPAVSERLLADPR